MLQKRKKSRSSSNITNEETTDTEYKLHHISISRCSSSQGSTHHIVHATFNLGYDQCHLCHHHHQKQLFREMPALMPAIAHPVDHSGGSHIHLFTKARMTKAPP